MTTFTPCDISNHHKCYPEEDGDWIVFRCPLCDDFERKVHRTTRIMRTKCHPDNRIPHFGSYESLAIQLADLNCQGNFTN